LSSSPGRRSGKIPSSVHPLEADNAGMVSWKPHSFFPLVKLVHEKVKSSMQLHLVVMKFH